jgi:hypothetical protein
MPTNLVREREELRALRAAHLDNPRSDDGTAAPPVAQGG